MLIGKSRDAQVTFLGRLRDIGPIDMRSNVGLSDFVERRIEKPMMRANLNRLAKFGSGKSVIDRQNKSALQFRRDGVDPIELRLICGLSRRRIDKDESFAIQADQFAAQIDRHCIEQFVGKMNANERFELIE